VRKGGDMTQTSDVWDRVPSLASPMPNGLGARVAAGQNTLIGSARLNVLLNSALAAALTARLSASVKPRLKARLDARLSTAVRLPLSA